MVTEGSLLTIHCRVYGAKLDGTNVELAVNFDPPPHPHMRLRTRTLANLFRFARSSGIDFIDRADLFGKNTVSTYVEADVDPPLLLKTSHA